MCIPTIPTSANQRIKENIDWLGFIFLAIFIISVVFTALSFTNIVVNNKIVISLLAVAILTVIALLYWEQRCQHPLLSPRLFSQKRFIICAIFSMTIGSFYGLAFFIIPFYLNNAQGLNDLNVGLFLLPTTLIIALISMYIGRIIEKGVPLKLLLCLGFLALMLGSLLQLYFTAVTSLWLVVIPLIILGIGWGLVTNPSSVVSLECGDESMSGVILGTIWTMLNIGSSVTTAIGTALFHGYAKATLLQNLRAQHVTLHSYNWINSVISDPHHAITTLAEQTALPISSIHQLFAQYFMSGYHAAMSFLAILALVTCFIIWIFLPTDKKKHKAAEAQQRIAID